MLGSKRDDIDHHLGGKEVIRRGNHVSQMGGKSVITVEVIMENSSGNQTSNPMKLEYHPSHRVGTLLRQVEKMNNITQASPSVSYGLFLDKYSNDEEKSSGQSSGYDNNGGKWLEEEATIADYAGNQNHIKLVFRNQTLFLKVCDLHEELTKTIPFNESRPLKDQMSIVTKRFGLPHHLEYALQKVQKSKSVWLNTSQSLYAQCCKSDKLILRRKYFLMPNLLLEGSAATIHFGYCEARNLLLHGYLKLTETECVELAALQMQIMYKNYDPLIHTHQFVPMEDVLPPEFAHEYMESEVFSEYRKLRDIKESDAKMKFLRKCVTDAMFGASVYLACESMESFESQRARLLGVKHNEVVCCDAKTKELLWTDNLFVMQGLVHHDRAVQWNMGLAEQVVRRSFMFEGPEEAASFCEYYHQYIAFAKMDEAEINRTNSVPLLVPRNDRFRSLSVSPKHRKIRARSASSDNIGFDVLDIK